MGPWISLVGMATLIAVGVVLSKDRRAINLRTVGAAFALLVSQAEAPLVVRPYIRSISDSQLFTIMVTGMSTVAGSMLAGYAAMGIRIDYLVAASVMAAPAGLLMAKILYPDSLEPDEAEPEIDIAEQEEHAVNIIAAAAEGAANGTRIAVNVGAIVAEESNPGSLHGGMLIANPIPAQYALNSDTMNRYIEQADAEAAELGISGKEITPYLLQRIFELSDGASLEANVQLILNNARLGAQIALAVCNLRSKKS